MGMQRVSEDFAGQIKPTEWSTGQEVGGFNGQLEVYLNKFQDPTQSDAMSRLQTDLSTLFLTNFEITKLRVFIKFHSTRILRFSNFDTHPSILSSCYFFFFTLIISHHVLNITLLCFFFLSRFIFFLLFVINTCLAENLFTVKISVLQIAQYKGIQAVVGSQHGLDPEHQHLQRLLEQRDIVGQRHILTSH